MKRILSVLTAVVLFAFSFTFSSCKKCSKDQPQPEDKANGADADVVEDRDTTSNPSDDSDASNGNITDPALMTQDALSGNITDTALDDYDSGASNGKITHNLGGSQAEPLNEEQRTIDDQLNEAAIHAARVAYWAYRMSKDDLATLYQWGKTYRDNAFASIKKIDEIKKKTKGAKGSPDQYIAKRAKAIDLLQLWALLKSLEAKLAYGKTGLVGNAEAMNTARQMGIVKSMFDDEKKADNVGALELAKARYALAVNIVKEEGCKISLLLIDIK
jgi:hypothetical protein